MRHLLPQVEAALDWPPDKRIEFIRKSGWIPEGAREAVLANLENLLGYPRCIRMPNLLLTAETNSGKTTLVTRFSTFHPFVDEDDGIEAPVVMIEAPAQADEKRIYAAIIEKLDGRPSGWARTSQLEYQAITLLKHCKTRVLVIDEFQHFNTSRHIARAACLNAIKSLSNKLQLSIVAVGLPEALKAINADPQLANRFDRSSLEPLSPDKQLAKVLLTFEAMLPLRKPSLLWDPSMMDAIMQRTQGLFGEICKLLKLSGEHAVTSGEECITLLTLGKCGYISPSENEAYARLRKRQPG